MYPWLRDALGSFPEGFSVIFTLTKSSAVAEFFYVIFALVEVPKKYLSGLRPLCVVGFKSGDEGGRFPCLVV